MSPMKWDWNHTSMASWVSLSVCLYATCVVPAYGAGENSLPCVPQPTNGTLTKCGDNINPVAAEKSDAHPLQQSPDKKTAANANARTYLTKTWDLDGEDDRLAGDSQSPLRPHRTSYLIVRKTSHPNLLPDSPATAHTVLTPLDINVTELKFQFSQKAMILNSRPINFLGIKSFRLWGAYTQQSSWQAFNSQNSSPFRETNYEPELIATFGTNNKHGLKLINLGFVHQSNGKDLVGSRSWNRAYLQGGWETETLSALVRRWWRFSESYLQDDNPDIMDYIGPAEIVLRWSPIGNSQVVELILRDNLKSNQNHSFVQIDWATPLPLSKSTKLHVQLTSGYGESLIDYNHRQTTFGLGVSFRDW